MPKIPLRSLHQTHGVVTLYSCHHLPDLEHIHLPPHFQAYYDITSLQLVPEVLPMTSASAPRQGVSLSFPWPKNLTPLAVQRPQSSNLILDLRGRGETQQQGDVATLAQGEEWEEMFTKDEGGVEEERRWSANPLSGVGCGRHTEVWMARERPDYKPWCHNRSVN